MRANEAFESTARRYLDTVYRVAFSYMKNRADAEDVTQNALLALFRTHKSFESEAHRKHWLLRVTVNECRMLWRSRRYTEDIGALADVPAFEDEQCRELFEAVMSLDVKYRTAVLLYYYEGYSTAETAEILGLPPNTVSTRLSRARTMLKTMLTEAETP